MNVIEVEKHITSSLISLVSASTDPKTPEEIRVIAGSIASFCKYNGDLDNVVREAMTACDTRMGIGISLVDPDAEHDEDWVSKREEIQWTYAEAYEKLLVRNAWAPDTIHSLRISCSKILGHLQDPKTEGNWDRRGLVIGHVQSGKTSNYIGVIARAADAGYKFIIVIAGIHNNLRKQTQERIDEGFIGRSSDPERRRTTGVGLELPDYPHPATLTNIRDDFNSHTADTSGWQINDFSRPVIVVIKKNAHTLNALHRWLVALNARGSGTISDVPMLMIDDEADNASINTNRPDLQPTRINTLIRKILATFTKSCYIGYTATPFANIFIDRSSYDEEAYEELFPRDFIYCLDASNKYFGPHRVFFNDESGSGVLRTIEDCERYIPLKHKQYELPNTLPPSLIRALMQFVLVRAIRNLRGQKNSHCSMMINVSRFIAVQKSIYLMVSYFMSKLVDAVKANYAMPEALSGLNSYMIEIKDEYTKEFENCGFDWKEVKANLYAAAKSIRIYVVNTSSDEALDYRKYEADGESLTAVAIGGFSLSRGLTIEGLCVSYMYRSTRYYDTLMQMGRWFGYRSGYEDLCRIHLHEDAINWYAHITNAAEELRDQIHRMRRDGLSPWQFGLYVRAHPDRLLITAPNRMRSAEMVTISQNYSGRLVESYILPKDHDVNRKNEDLIRGYWETGFGGKPVESTPKGWIIRNVPIGKIMDFLDEFQTHAAFDARKQVAMAYLRKIADRFTEGDVLLISIGGNGENAAEYRLGTQIRNLSNSNWSNAWRASQDRVASRGDEKLGLSVQQLSVARRLAEGGEQSKPLSDCHYREARNRPLLMLHVINPNKGDEYPDRVPAFGISFPPGLYGTEVLVAATALWVNSMYGTPISESVESDELEVEYDRLQHAMG